MMTRLMKVKTNASTYLAAYEKDNEALYILDNEYTNSDKCALEDVEDYSSWTLYEGVDDLEGWLGIGYFDIDILDEVFKEDLL